MQLAAVPTLVRLHKTVQELRRQEVCKGNLGCTFKIRPVSSGHNQRACLTQNESKSFLLPSTWNYQVRANIYQSPAGIKEAFPSTALYPGTNLIRQVVSSPALYRRGSQTAQR